jgi:hypothetical protein
MGINCIDIFNTRVACDNVSGEINILIWNKSMPQQVTKIKENEIKT